MNPNDYPTKHNLLQAQKKYTLAKKGHALLEKKKQSLLIKLREAKKNFMLTEKKMTAALEIAYTALEISYRDAGHECVEALRHKSPYSLAESTASIDEAHFAWRGARVLLVAFAEAQARLYQLTYAIRKTQKKASALENVTIPTCEARIKYIQSQLEERERDERIRLRFVKNTAP
ncbi:MAG: V-type ATP synthase subunit D [Defluviitaleaceae bacterium]|nr:V-type ATP synthase subunit D [Defluviitaleaceae bacterium]MCL2273705.1 V-type ATP synthase subunit D [Defluviitaleaceae bacterium]